MPLKDDIAEAKVPIVQLPTVLGSVVPAYNIPGVTAELKFTPEALAGIYLGKITQWNDKAIASVNPGVKLPDKPSWSSIVPTAAAPRLCGPTTFPR